MFCVFVSSKKSFALFKKLWWLQRATTYLLIMTSWCMHGRSYAIIWGCLCTQKIKQKLVVSFIFFHHIYISIVQLFMHPQDKCTSSIFSSFATRCMSTDFEKMGLIIYQYFPTIKYRQLPLINIKKPCLFEKRPITVRCICKRSWRRRSKHEQRPHVPKPSITNASILEAY